MYIEIIELSERKAKLILHDTTPYYANMLRRTLMADVPKMAIEDVEFHLGPIRDEDGREYESVSPLFDEIIAHRLGLLPIPTDLTVMKRREECACGGEGCPTCTVMYTLNKKGPGMVYSGDLEPLGDAKLAIKEKRIPIAFLDWGQALLIYATAIMGTGKEHVKWQAAHAVGYKYYPELILDEEKCDKCRMCIEACPRNILELKKGKIIMTEAEKCTLCNSCVEVCEQKCIQIKAQEDKILFQFETDGALSAKCALEKALEIIVERFAALEKSISKMKKRG